MFFKKKIIVTEEMKQTLQSFDEISWASFCGIHFDKLSDDCSEIKFTVYSTDEEK